MHFLQGHATSPQNHTNLDHSQTSIKLLYIVLFVNVVAPLPGSHPAFRHFIRIPENQGMRLRMMYPGNNWGFPTSWLTPPFTPSSLSLLMWRLINAMLTYSKLAPISTLSSIYLVICSVQTRVCSWTGMERLLFCTCSSNQFNAWCIYHSLVVGRCVSCISRILHSFEAMCNYYHL